MSYHSNQCQKSDSRPRDTIQHHQKPVISSNKKRKSLETLRYITQNDPVLAPVKDHVPSNNSNRSGLLS